MLDELDDLIDKVCGDARTYSDAESIERLHRSLARLEAATTVAVAAFDAAGGWRGSGARTAAGWLSVRCNLPKSTASRRVQLGRACATFRSQRRRGSPATSAPPTSRPWPGRARR